MTMGYLFYVNKYPVLIYIVHGPTISLSQRWQRTHEGKIILAANEVKQHAPGVGLFSFGGEWGGVGFLLFSVWFYEILTVFPSSSQ